MRISLVILSLLVVGCATVDTLRGTRTFTPFKGVPVYTYEGDDIVLSANGSRLATIPPMGAGSNWWEFRRWSGVAGEHYLEVACDEARGYDGTRTCTLKQLLNCPWDSARQVCTADGFTLVNTQDIAAPDNFASPSKPSRLSGRIGNGSVTLLFDGAPVVAIPATSVLRGNQYTSYYQGELAGENAEVSCRLRSAVVGQDPNLECLAYREINGRNGKISGLNHALAVIAKTSIPWSKESFAATKEYTDRNYLVGRWPRLNPNKPDEVPERKTNTQSAQAVLLQKELKTWAE